MGYKLTNEQIKKVVEKGTRALFEYCRNNKINYIITGSSGGLDSAITLGFAKKTCEIAKKNNFSLTSVGLIMPCESSPRAEILGREAIKKFNAEEIKIDLSATFEFVNKEIEKYINPQVVKLLKKTKSQEALTEWEYSKKIAQGNVKARLRMIIGTYHVAKMMKGIVLSTDNFSEFWMSFWTICGDVGDFGIIQEIFKGIELYDIARYLEVPQDIINSKPDDGLGIGKGDEDQIGAKYSIIDTVMIKLIQNGFDPDGSINQLDRLPTIKGISTDLVFNLAKRSIKGAYKRKGTVILTREELGLPPIKSIKIL